MVDHSCHTSSIFLLWLGRAVITLWLGGGDSLISMWMELITNANCNQKGISPPNSEIITWIVLIRKGQYGVQPPQALRRSSDARSRHQQAETTAAIHRNTGTNIKSKLILRAMLDCAKFSLPLSSFATKSSPSFPVCSPQLCGGSAP